MTDLGVTAVFRVPPSTRFLLAAHLALGIFLLIGVAIFLRVSRKVGGAAEESDPFLMEAKSVASLLKSELERIRLETQATAELATHIFSNPESYRLAAQPGEYDYDKSSGVYGSARDDGTSVVFLSAASSLSPEILREIRLSEYLNPVFKASRSSNPLIRSVTLHTTDGLVRSYPWFDFKARIASGALKATFSVIELPFFPKAIPSRNPAKEGVWDLVSSGSQSGEIQLVCSAPFFAGDSLRGLITIGVDSASLALQLFRNVGPALGLLMAGSDRVLGTSRKLEPGVEFNTSLTGVLKDLRVPGLTGLEPVLRRPTNADGFVGGRAGFHVAVAPITGLPLKPVLIVPELIAVRPGGSVPTSSAPIAWVLTGAALAGGLLLADAWWIRKTWHNRSSEKELRDSFRALSDLNLQSALATVPQDMLSELYPKLDEGQASTQEQCEPQSPVTVPESTAPTKESLGLNLRQLECQAAVFSAFNAANSAEDNLNRLAASLRESFQAHSVTFFSHSGSDLRILPQGNNSFEEVNIEWKQGPVFGALKGSQGVVSSNVLPLSPEEQQLLSPLIPDGSFLAAPLLDGRRLLGAVVLSAKPSAFSAEDRVLLEALQGLLSKALHNVLQCDDLAKLNQLRREYCLKLAKAVQTPLDRIRAEVQSIYARLGKLTPYYKQHCETILFEVGKLYEMLREAREGEMAMESRQASPATTPENVLATVAKKESE